MCRVGCIRWISGCSEEKERKRERRGEKEREQNAIVIDPTSKYLVTNRLARVSPQTLHFRHIPHFRFPLLESVALFRLVLSFFFFFFLDSVVSIHATVL